MEGGSYIIAPTSPLYHASMCVHVFSNVCLYQGTKRRNKKRNYHIAVTRKCNITKGLTITQ